MNPDTAPIAEIEDWLAPRLGWTRRADGKWTIGGDGEFDHPIIGHAMEDAIACLPPGSTWVCSSTLWTATITGLGEDQYVHVSRTQDPLAARDELIRLAAKAWQKVEEAQ